MGFQDRFCTLLLVVTMALLLNIAPSFSSKLRGLSHIFREDHEPVRGASGLSSQFQLLHRDHPRSPFYVPDLTHTQKVQNAVRSSNNRAAELFGRMAFGTDESSNAVKSNDGFVTPIASQGLHNIIYSTEMTIGTPARTFTVSFDTGSDLSWVQCLPCANCPNQRDALFNPAESSSYRNMHCNDAMCSNISSHFCSSTRTCQYRYGYGVGNGAVTSGDFAFESITLNKTTGSTMTFMDFGFGCGHLNKGEFYLLDGMLGLGQGPVSFFSQLGSHFGYKFSYCLASFLDNPTNTSPLIFGNAAVPSAKLETFYTPLKSSIYNPTFYYIGLLAISINNERLSIPESTFAIDFSGHGGVFVDSGSPFSLLVPDAYDPLLGTLKSIINYPEAPGSSSTSEFGLCYNLSSVSYPTFPTLTFEFEGFLLELPSENVFIPVDHVNGCYCLAFLPSSYGFNIIGTIQLQNYQILLDGSKHQFGFAKIQCDTL